MSLRGDVIAGDSLTTLVGIGITTPVTPLHVRDTTSRTAFTGTGAGSVLIEESNGNTHYTTLDFAGSGSTSGIAQSRIASLQEAAGSTLVFGTSNTYGSGITNSAMGINPAGRVGIGTVAPATSALLELASTIGALLVPRMTTAQRDALTAVNGMIIYNSTTATMQGYVAGAWANL